MYRRPFDRPAAFRCAARPVYGLVPRGRCDCSSILALGSVAVAAVLILSLAMSGRRNGGDEAKPLTLFCAAGLRQPTEQIVSAFERECGVQVQVQYGPSNTLLGQIEAGGVGDLFLVGEERWRIWPAKGLAEWLGRSSGPCCAGIRAGFGVGRSERPTSGEQPDPAQAAIAV